MDNFEWARVIMKFGLYEVDFKTQKRTLRQGSKHLFKLLMNRKRAIAIILAGGRY